MKVMGWLLAGIGVCYAIWAFNMDVSVSVSSTYIPGYGSVAGGDVANLDLMARRQNHLIFASVLTVIGVLIGLLAPGENKSSPPVAAPSPVRQLRAYEGDRDLSLDAYRLWLADEYEINRNDLFDRFVMGDVAFESLDAALTRANELENQKQARAEEAQQEQLRKEEEWRLHAERVREESEAEWQRNKPRFIAAGIIVALLAAVGIYFLFQEANKTRAAELALLHTETAQLKKDYDLDLSPSNVRRISEVGEFETYLCDDKKSGSIVHFGADTKSEDILPVLDKPLGQHKTEYEYEGSGEWSWSKRDTRFILHSISSELTLCVLKGSKSSASSVKR
jgi:hypothetical protein